MMHLLQLLIVLLVSSVYAGFDYPYSEVKFSEDRGFYSAPFNLTLRPPNSLLNSTMTMYLVTPTKVNADPLEVHLLIGSQAQPNLIVNKTNGLVFSGPIVISRTCYVSAISYNATHSTNLTVSTYIFVDDVVKTLYAPYVQQATPAKMIQGLLSMPVLSMTTQYPYVLEGMLNRSDYEKPGWLEWIDPKNPSDNWLSKMSYELYGGYSRVYPKKNWRIHFSEGGDDGDGKLDFRLFKGFDTSVGTSRVFKSLDLRSHSQDGVFTHGVFRGLYMKNIFADWAFTDVPELISVHSRYVNVYYNGYFVGLHHMRERLGGHFFKQYLGGENEDYQGINSGRTTGDAGVGNFSSTYALFTTNCTYQNCNNFFDWKSYFAFVLYEHYAANLDLGTHNWQCGGPLKPKPWNNNFRNYGGWKFYASDDDITFNSEVWGNVFVQPGYWFDTTGANNPMAGLTFFNLVTEAHPDFMLKFQDHIYQFVEKKDAILSTEATHARFYKIYNTFDLDACVSAELGRWGYLDKVSWPGGVNNYPGSRTYSQWKKDVDDTHALYINFRKETMLNRYNLNGWMNKVGAPSFSLDYNAIIPFGTIFSISASNKALLGTVNLCYTTNGQDPRLPGGAVNPNAILVSGRSVSLQMTEPTFFSVRVWANGKWGVLDTIHIFPREDPKKCEMCGKVIFTEVNYNPGKGKNQSHFIEVKNIGKKPITMTGATISRHMRNNYTFPPLVLAPGQFWVIGFYLEDFYEDYGKKKYPDDLMLCRLSETKEGDDLTLLDQYDNIVNHISFEADSYVWSKFADGMNFTLVARPEFYEEISKLTSTKSSDYFRYWRYSTNPMGSPWNDDPPEPENRKVYLTFDFVSFEKEWIEISNPTNKDIDISSWLVADKWTGGNNHEYQIPSKTVVPAMSSLKLHLGFDIERNRDLMIFRYDPKWKVYTGNFVEFQVKDFELAF